MEIEIRRTFDLLDHLVNEHPKEDILAGKQSGEWVKYSCYDYYKYAHYLACGFLEIGLDAGDRIVTVSPNCPEWNFVDMAMAMTGIIHVPVYPTLSTENYLHILTHSEAKAVLVNNNTLLKRLRPALEKMEQKPMVFTLANIEGERRMLEILKAGIASKEKNMPIVEERKQSIKPEDWCTLIYTSGTTGAPKGVMLSHRNLCSNFVAHSKVNIIGDKSHILSFLPLNHVYERSMNYHYQYLGASIYYAESMGTIARDLADIHADGFCAVPRVIELFYDKLYAAGKDMKGLRRRIYFRAINHGCRWDYGKVKYNLWFKLGHIVYDKLVYSKWREKFGGHRMTIVTGSSSIPPRLVKLFSAAGLNIYEGYGLSETSPVIAVNNPHDHLVKIGTVGPILSNVEMKLADDGEILTRGPHVMMGYFKDPDYTKEVIDADGWFHTGDIGKMVSGKYLKITDRKKDIFKLSAGKYIAPQVLENRFREDEFIDQIMIIGENEKFCSAIISPNFNTLHYWAMKHNLHYRDNESLVSMEAIHKKYQSIVDAINPDFAAHEQVKRFRLVSEEWTTANGLLSPTLKIKRNVLHEKYKSIINEIYQKEEPKSNPIISAFKSIELPSLPFYGKKKN